MNAVNYQNTPIHNGLKSLIHDKIKKGYYYISDNGDVYSFPNARFLKKQTDKDGYNTISLRNKDGKIVTWSIHLLMMIANNINPPQNIKDPTIDHINKIRTDNKIENLRWRERSDNCSDRYTTPKGEINGRAKLTESDVIEIWNYLKNNKYTVKELSNIYNISQSVIRDIKNKKLWKYLTDTL